MLEISLSQSMPTVEQDAYNNTVPLLKVQHWRLIKSADDYSPLLLGCREGTHPSYFNAHAVWIPVAYRQINRDVECAKLCMNWNFTAHDAID